MQNLAQRRVRVVSALLVEINEKMVAAERRYIAAASVAGLLEDDDVYRPWPQHPGT